MFNSAPLFHVELVEMSAPRCRIIHAGITPRFPFVRKPREADVCTSDRRLLWGQRTASGGRLGVFISYAQRSPSGASVMSLESWGRMNGWHRHRRVEGSRLGVVRASWTRG